jgi:hypothetical protein
VVLAHEVDVCEVMAGVEADEERDARDLRREEPGPGERRHGQGHARQRRDPLRATRALRDQEAAGARREEREQRRRRARECLEGRLDRLRGGIRARVVGGDRAAERATVERHLEVAGRERGAEPHQLEGHEPRPVRVLDLHGDLVRPRA